jgi:hypothetical protein
LGWSTRRIAGEVNTSQASVVRILERLKKDPPDPATVVMNSTPPGGMPAVRQFPLRWDDEEARGVPRHVRYGTVALFVLTLLLLGALAATLIAAGGGFIARGKTGPAGPPGPAGAAAPERMFELCVRYSTFSGAVVSLTAPDKHGSCGTATLIRVPG